MNGIPATLHGPGLPGVGEACRLGFGGGMLVVAATETVEVPVESLTVTTGGFDDDTMLLNWARDGATFSAVIVDKAAQRALVQAAPAGIAPMLLKGHRDLRYHQRKWNAVLWTLGILVLAIVLGWWQSEAITAWIAQQVPVAREERLGEILLTQLQAEGGLRDEGPGVDAVKSIGTRLTEGSRYHYQWFVKDDPEVNAFAGPGGVVVVYSGLIAKTDSAEELAGVLAHEIQHVEARHTLQAMIHSAGWAAILAVTLGDVSAISGVLIHQVGNLRHSRKLEREADIGGVKALARAGISPAAMTGFFGKLAAEQKKSGGDAGFELLSTHPATADRLAEVAGLVAATPCECRPLEFDWAAVKADVDSGNEEADTGDADR
ncbi:MAG: M48 family metallopeptidase [Steroidobacteraceae bacterium]